MNRQEIYAIGFPAKNAYMPFIDFVLDYATHGDKILDVGGGEGAYSAELIKRGFNCVNVDLNREYIRSSRARGVDSLISSATSLALKDRSFDVVLMFETLEHIVDFERALYEAKRVARKHILITVPNCGGYERLKLLHLTYDHFLATDHVNFFTKGYLEQVLSNYFCKIEVREEEPIWPSYLLPPYIRYPFRKLIELGIIRPYAYYRLYAAVEI
jgi:Methylase involved in ubiquinone/menaquinone biosynthesis